MAKRRDAIRMTPEEMKQFVSEQKSLQVATLNKDGTPHLSTLWFGIMDDEIVFETYTKSQKIVNLHRDSRIAVLLEDGVEYEKLRGITINGTAELYSAPEDVQKYAAAVISRNHGIDLKDASDAAAALANKRTAVVVKAEKVVSWDHTKLGGTY